jgi:hypothetical protein
MTSNGFVVGLDVKAHEAGYDAYRGLKSFPRIEAEKNLLRELQRKQQESYYEVRKGKVHFTDEARVRQKISLKRLASFLRDAPFLVLLTTPLIWFCAVRQADHDDDRPLGESSGSQRNSPGRREAAFAVRSKAERASHPT